MSRSAHKISRKKKSFKLEPLEPRTLFSADILSAAIIAAPLQDTQDIDQLSSEWAGSLHSEDGSIKAKRSAFGPDSTATINKPIFEHRTELSDFNEEIAANPPGGPSTSVIQVSTTDDVVDGDTTSFDALILDSGADGKISLREAIQAANNQTGTDTIQLSQGLYTLTITGKFEGQSATGDLDITSDIILEGTNSSTTFIAADNLDDRLFEVHAGASLIASNITLQDGGSNSTPGGAVRNEGNLTLTDVSLINNIATNTPGGALWNSGTSQLTNVEFLDNTANSGGAIHNEPTGSFAIDSTTFSRNVSQNGLGGAINNEGSLTIENSALINNTAPNGGAINNKGGNAEIVNTTISGNEATFRGGGITITGGSLSLESSTISSNSTANVGAGLNVVSGTVTTSNSIYSDNTVSTGFSDIYGTIISNGVNIIKVPDSGSFSGESSVDLIGIDPKLLGLGSYGGLTPTHAIDTTSPAYNTANANYSPTHDQRGSLRDSTPDIGAYEVGGGIPPNQAPLLTLSNSSVNYIENEVLVVDPNASITDADSVDFDTGVLAVTSTAFTETIDLLAINSVGTGPGEIFVSGSTVLYEGAVIGTWTGGTGSTPLEITLNNTASAASVTALAQNITFRIDSQAPSTQTRTLEFTVSDGDGGTSVPAGIDITVQGINQAPEIKIAFGRVFINEFHYDDYFQDENERIEIAGGAGTDLNGWRLVLYSTGATTYRTIHLSGILPDQSNGIGTTYFDVPNLQNGPNDGIALINPDGVVVEFISYEGTITATVGPAVGMTSTDVGAQESNLGSSNNSIQRTDLGDGFIWTGPTNNTFGDFNNGQSTANVNHYYRIDEDTSITFSQANSNPLTISDIDTKNNINITVSVNSGTLAFASGSPNTSNITMTGTLAELNSSLDGLMYQPDPNFNGQDTLTITVDDQDISPASNKTATDSISIDVLPVNDAPVVQYNSVLDTTQLEDDFNPTTIKVADLFANQSTSFSADIDAFALTGLAVVRTANTNGDWQFSLNNGNTWESFGTTSSTAATVLDNTAEIRFIPDPDFAGITSIEFRAWDQTDGIASGTKNVDVSTNGGSTPYSESFRNKLTIISQVDDKPALSLDVDNSSGATQDNYLTSYTAGGSPVTITDTDALLSDIDSSTLDELTITLDNPLDGSIEQLSVDTSAYTNFSQSFNNTTNTITVSATNGAVADYEAILKTATYHNSSTTPTIADRTITLVATDHTSLTVSAQSTVQIVPDNSAPIVSNNAALTTAEGVQGEITNLELSATDDIQPLTSVNYTITAAPSYGFIAHTSAQNTPITQFSQSMLDANQIVYVHDGSESSGDQFEFSVDDSVGNSNANNTFLITITAVNDPPGISAPSVLTVFEDNTLTIGSANAITVSDNDGASVEVMLSVTSGTLSLIDSTGILNINGSDSSLITVDGDILAVNTALNGLSYRPVDNFNGSDTLNIQTNDLGQSGAGGVLTDTTSINLTIDPISDAPTGASNTISVLEDQAYIFAASDFGYNDIDGDTFSDIVLTSIPANGTLTLQSTPVNLGDTIPVSGINQGLLIFQPTSHLNGTGLTGFDFKVGDNGTTANGGESRALTPSSIAFDIVAVNDPPTGQDNTVNTDEDTTYVFTEADFGFADPIDNHTFKQLEIVSIPANGSLLINNADVIIGSIVSTEELSEGKLAFIPDPDATGSNYASFRFLVSDNGGITNNGTDQDPTFNTIIVNVDAINDAPSGTDATISLLEDSSIILSSVDFGFSDLGDNHSFQGVVLTTDPTSGQLLQNGNPITSGSIITASALAAGAITFEPDSNAHGLPYASLTFQVQDNGGTLNGGENTDQQANTLIFNVEAVSDEPAGTDKQLNISESTNYTFSLLDFGFVDALDAPDSDQFLSLEINQLPGNGSLLHNNQPITTGHVVSAADIVSGRLVYIPPAYVSGNAIDTIDFSVIDSGDTTNNGQIKDATANIITINISGVSNAPSGSDNTLSILEDSTYTLNSTDFGFTDTNDNDSFASAILTNTPVNGSLTLAGVAVTDNQTILSTDIDNGKLQYTPASNESGISYSSFSFLVQDTGSTNNGGENIAQNTNTLTFDVTPVSDEPIGLDNLITINEDNNHIFSLSDFGFADPLDSASPDQLHAIVITQPPITGTLYNNNLPILAGQTIAATDIDSALLVYAPSPNTFGQAFDNLSFQVIDTGSTANSGQTQDQTANTIIFDINSVNDAPTGSDNTIQIAEDSTHVFSSADFGFSDSIDQNSLLDIQISSINGSGELLYNGIASQSPMTITSADINAGLLSYKPVTNDAGTNYASILFKVRDSGGTLNGGIDADPTVKTLTIDVASVNDAPAGTDTIIQTREDESRILDLVDFGFSDPDNNQFEAVLIDTLPATGTLQLAGQTIIAGTVVNATSISLNELVYVPDTNIFGPTALKFLVIDNGGTANSGNNTDQSVNTLTINTVAVNDAPTGNDQTIQINEDNNYTFTTSDFGFSDSIDQHSLLEIYIASANGIGTLSHNGSITTTPVLVSAEDIDNGLLSYTPVTNTSGTNYASLTFNVRDTGGVSNGGQDTDLTANTLTINVAGVNDAPAGTDNIIQTREDEPKILNSVDFGFSDLDNHQFEAVIIHTLPTIGRLELAGQTITAGATVNTENMSLNELVYIPEDNINGSTDFQFSVIDDGGTAGNGQDTDQTANTLTIEIVAVNDAPTGSDKTIQIDEDNNYVFSSSDFGFSDPFDQHQLMEVDIKSINGAGALLYIGSPASDPLTISHTEIDAGVLSFIPDPNTSGSNYASVAFTVRDTGGIANGGIDTATTENLLTIDVTGVNDPPSGTDNTIETREDEPRVLRLIDFGFSDPDNNQFDTVVINTLPITGTLQLAGQTITAGTSVEAASIALGNFIYVPQENINGSTSFQFSVIDDGGTAGNGRNQDQSANTLSITILPINDAPLSANRTISTNEDTPYQFQITDFPFSDLFDSDRLSEIIIVSVPAEGTLMNTGAVLSAGDTVSASNIENGELVFSPSADNSTTQSFEFKARDTGGINNGGHDTTTNTNTITLNIVELNDTPTLLNESLTIDEGSRSVISTNELTATDPDDTSQDLSFGILQLPEHGQLTIDGVILNKGDRFSAADLSQNKIHYRHNGSETSADYFDFTLTDGDTTTQVINGRFTININEVIDPPPKPKNNNFTVEQGHSFDTNSGDTLASGDNTLLKHPNLAVETFKIDIITQPVNGEISLDSDGGFIYIHNGSDNLDDYFEYRITNEDGISAAARVNITVEPAIANAINQPIDPNFEELFTTAPNAESNNNDETSEREVITNEEPEETEEAPKESLAAKQPFSEESEYASSATSTAISVDYNVNETDIGISNTTTNYSRVIYIDRPELENLDVRKHNPLDDISKLGESVNVTVKSIDLLVDMPLTAADVINSHNFQQGLSRANNDLESMVNDTRTRFQSSEDLVFGVSISTTAGVLAWMLRGGALLGSMMAATPLWATIDPLRVAAPIKSNNDEDNTDEVEDIFK